jgi:predicted transposase YbfD/YdcC
LLAAEDRNEVDAALEVIGLLDLKGKIVTADALHCNRRMVEAIVEKGGDYCIALKGNQDSLLSDARACLAKADKPSAKRKYPVAKTETNGHGRIETRVGVIVEAKRLAEYHEFPGLKAFGRIEASRVIDGKTESDVRIFALSRKLSPRALLKTARSHWQIENGLHWQLDVSFGEDAARNRKDNGPSNIAVIRRRVLDVARLDQSKGSLTAKLKRAGWNDEFMLKLLSQMR